jgi:predicted component of type VI protein secretion system
LLRFQHGFRWRLVALAALAGLVTGLVGVSCASGGKPQKACLKLDASGNLNFFNGQAHVLTVYFYPLASSLGFEQANVDDLLGGDTPPGVLAPPASATIRPGEEGRQFEDVFPNETSHIGVIADYYRSPGDPEGTRRQVVRAKCGWLGKPKLVFSARDLYQK